MLPIQTILMLTTGFYWPAVNIIAPADSTPPTQVVIEAQALAEAEGGTPHIIKLNGNAIAKGADAGIWVAGVPADPNGAPHEGLKLRMVAPGAADLPAGGPWLGVQFGPVPKPLAAHLKLDDEKGQMILNVAEGSPADVAGLQQYDVITALDGQSATGDIGAFLEVVRSWLPNQSHSLTIMRGSQQVQLTLTVGARPAADAMPKFKYQSAVEELAKDRVFGRSGMLQKDDQGNWTFNGFNSQNLPDFWKSIPDASDLDFNIMVPAPGDGQQNRVFVQKSKGEEVRISTDADGQITVTRTKTEDGNSTTTTNTYPNQEQFAASEPELSKRFSFSDESGCAMLFSPEGKAGAHAFKFLTKLDPSAADWQGQLHEHLMELKDLHGFSFAFGKPQTRFEIEPNGMVRVTTRTGEDELVERFNNVTEMQTSRPDLYEKYQRFQERTSSKQ